MKKLLTLFTLLLTVCSGAWATDVEIPLTNLKNFPLDYGLVTITNTENTSISSDKLTVKKNTAKFCVSTKIDGVYLKSISFTDTNSSKNGGFTCTDNESYMPDPVNHVYTYTAPNTTTTEANFQLIGNGGTAEIGTIIITVSTSDQVERLTGFGSISNYKIPFTSSATTTNVELSIPTSTSNGVSASSSKISIGSGGKHLIVSTKNDKVIKKIAIPKYQQSTYPVTGASDPEGTYSSDVWTPSASDVTSVDLTLTVSSTVYSQEIYVIYEDAAPAHTITLDKNGGDVDGEATATEGSATLTSITAPTRAGYSVEGYYDDNVYTNKIADASGNLQLNTTYTDGDGKWTSSSDEVKLYAKWEAATYTLTNEVNTEGYGTVSPASVTSIAYNTATSSSTNTYTVGETVVTATPAAATAEYTYAFDSWSGLPANVTEDATVTANFTRIPVDYTLSWNANGGDELTGEYTTGTVAFGTSITAPNTPTYDGHVFIGWAESADGAVVSAPTTMPAADKTYYAQWMEGTAATITYDLTTNTESTTFNACKSATPTSGDVVASTTINTYGTAGAASSGQSAKSGETQKLNIDDSYTAENYYEWTFTENGCTFAPTNVKIKFQAVSGLVQYKVALTDGITTKTTNFVQTTSAGGTLEELDWDITDGTVFAANKTVKLQIWAYKKGDGATAFRLGSPITIKGAVKSIPASVSGTITEAGWNTFSSNFALDLSKISGGTAYVAKTNDNTEVTMTKTTAKIAAGTGIMIKGTAGETFTISTTTDAATLDADNQLVGLPNGGTVAANAYNFVFAWETGDVSTAGFYYVDIAAPTLPAGKAYLNSEGVNGAKLNIVIDDTPSQEETDGIRSIENSELRIENSDYYNLSGQRVGKDYKGIVIVNGKKMLNK